MCEHLKKSHGLPNKQTYINKALEMFFMLNYIYHFYFTACLVSLQIQKGADEAESLEKGAVENIQALVVSSCNEGRMRPQGMWPRDPSDDVHQGCFVNRSH